MKPTKSSTKKSSIHRKKMNTNNLDVLDKEKGQQLDPNLMTKLKYCEIN